MNRTELKMIIEQNPEKVPEIGTYKDEIRKVYVKSQDCSGNRDNPLIVAIEELSELQKEIAKFLRFHNKITPFDNIGLEEEIADVLICIEHVKTAANLNDENINQIISIKIDRFLNNT